MLWLLPVITAFWIIGAFFITYAIAVFKGNVEPDFPYISYTAIHEPQKSIFSQLVNIGAILLGCTAYIRYLQVKTQYQPISRQETRCNTAGLILGLLSALGLSMVANFQAKTLKFLHYSGAFLAFGLGTVYCWVQTVITQKRYSPCIVWSRIFLSSSVSIILFVFITTEIFYKKYKYDGSKWNEHRTVYLTSTITEWLLATFILLYVFTFIREFRRVRLKLPEITDIELSTSLPENDHPLSEREIP